MTFHAVTLDAPTRLAAAAAEAGCRRRDPHPALRPPSCPQGPAALAKRRAGSSRPWAALRCPRGPASSWVWPWAGWSQSGVASATSAVLSAPRAAAGHRRPLRPETHGAPCPPPPSHPTPNPQPQPFPATSGGNRPAQERAVCGARPPLAAPPTSDLPTRGRVPQPTDRAPRASPDKQRVADQLNSSSRPGKPLLRPCARAFRLLRCGVRSPNGRARPERSTRALRGSGNASAGMASPSSPRTTNTPSSSASASMRRPCTAPSASMTTPPCSTTSPSTACGLGGRDSILLQRA